MEELKAMFRVCHYANREGDRCAFPAMVGLNFCFKHIGGNVNALRQAHTTTNSPAQRLDFVYPGDRPAIQHNLWLVLQALNEGKIETGMANTYNRLFRNAEQNLHRWEKSQNNHASLQPIANTVVIPTEVSAASEAEEPALSTIQTDVIPSERSDEGPAVLSPASAYAAAIAGTPCLTETSEKANHPKSPAQQRLEDIGYGRIPAPRNADY
ncbi:MAG: hypothetical protein WBD10_04000 [Acidobacteriaceae bacterium]